MRILHTADWHLGDRLGRIDRTDDLRRAVERVAVHCRESKADVLLVAGDLFSELARPDGLRETIRHWQDVFGSFLGGGGTILTLTGNHDNENFCRTLTHAMSLAAPTVGELGQEVPPGRLYLAAEPTFLQLNGVQFVLMPYPTPTRYLKGEAGQKYTSPEEKQKLLNAAFERTLREFREHERFQKLPTVLGSHATVRGAVMGFDARFKPDDDVLVSEARLHEDYDYVALGHIHKPQFLGGHEHVRYSGSIEKMDLGEQNDVKGVVLFELSDKGRVGEIVTLPLPSTPIYEVVIANPTEDIPRLRAEQAETSQDLVSLHISYTSGHENLEEVLRDLEQIFPRWYARDWKETSELGATLVTEDLDRTKSFSDTVRGYVDRELTNHDEAEREELKRRLDELLQMMD